MSDNASNNEKYIGVHWSFWVISGITLFFNVMGAINFFVQMSADSLDKFPEFYHPIIEGRPLWATAAFAVVVFGSTLGCLLLLLRRSSAYYVFVVSLLGVVVTMLHIFRVVGAGSFQVWSGVVMQLVVTAFLTWYSKYATGKTWLS